MPCRYRLPSTASPKPFNLQNGNRSLYSSSSFHPGLSNHEMTPSLWCHLNPEYQLAFTKRNFFSLRNSLPLLTQITLQRDVLSEETWTNDKFVLTTKFSQSPASTLMEEDSEWRLCPHEKRCQKKSQNGVSTLTKTAGIETTKWHLHSHERRTLGARSGDFWRSLTPELTHTKSTESKPKIISLSWQVLKHPLSPP